MNNKINTRIIIPGDIEWHKVDSELPQDDRLKLVICRSKLGFYSWNRAYYSNGYWHGSGSMAGVVMWADFDIVEEEIES